MVGKADARIISRRSFVKSLLKQDAHGIVTALDVGSGNGEFCDLLGEIGIAAIGIDKNQRLVNHRVLFGDWPDSIPDHIDKSFQFISMNESLYYFKDRRASLKAAYQKLDAGGLLFIKYRNANNTKYTPGDAYIRLFGEDVVEPIGSFIHGDLERAGFKVIRWLPYPEDNITLAKCYLSLYIPQLRATMEREARRAKHTIIIGKKVLANEARGRGKDGA